MPTPSDSDTIKVGKDYITANVDRGCLCPCCGRKQKTYRNHLTQEKVIGLMYMVRDFGLGESFHMVEYFQKLLINGEVTFASAAHAGIYDLEMWGFIQPTGNGHYQYTQEALDFLKKPGVMVPKYIETYNNVIVTKSRDLLTLKGALNEKFSLAKLMRYVQ